MADPGGRPEPALQAGPHGGRRRGAERAAAPRLQADTDRIHVTSLTDRQRARCRVPVSDLRQAATCHHQVPRGSAVRYGGRRATGARPSPFIHGTTPLVRKSVLPSGE
ncbi:hypothetical protein KNE206_06590 [Kitasatospora sp. NE20-6]